MNPTFAQAFESKGGAFTQLLDMKVEQASGDEVTISCPISEKHLQGYGIVHGGVYASIVETVCSIGAALWAMERGKGAVGLENHTSFLRAVRDGNLTAVATPVTRGRRSQVWETKITDAAKRVVATGTVRFLCIDEGSHLAGQSFDQNRPPAEPGAVASDQ